MMEVPCAGVSDGFRSPALERTTKDGLGAAVGLRNKEVGVELGDAVETTVGDLSPEVLLSGIFGSTDDTEIGDLGFVKKDGGGSIGS
mmetsp:Transcript_22193/g.48299  ORF Transcript_22193/g.48299 Transcript_22193/m.48299 type:complete len:87 (+) Transcript_22193:346-606(+)